MSTVNLHQGQSHTFDSGQGIAVTNMSDAGTAKFSIQWKGGSPESHQLGPYAENNYPSQGWPGTITNNGPAEIQVGAY